MILRAMRAGRITVLRSQFLVDEASATPDLHRRRLLLSIVRSFSEAVEADLRLMAEINAFRATGLTHFDAAHLAAAIAGRADVFCSCDDRLVRRGRLLVPSSLRVLQPVELAKEFRV